MFGSKKKRSLEKFSESETGFDIVSILRNDGLKVDTETAKDIMNGVEVELEDGTFVSFTPTR